VGSPDAEFEKRVALIEQEGQPFAHREPPMAALPLVPIGAAAEAQRLFLPRQFVGDVSQRCHGRMRA
jgi:hypothetical protein